MRRLPALLLPLFVLFAACSKSTPYVTTIGTLQPGTTMTVRLARGSLNAFRPAAGDPPGRFTVSATARKNEMPSAPRLRASGGDLSVTAPTLAQLLVRVPTGVDLVVDDRAGDVRITDISGNARVVAGNGDVTIMLPGYAQAHVGTGNILVRMGSTDWPGTLRFTSARGNVEVWVRETAAFHAHLRTGDGTLFTDFNLRGTAQGASEMIDGDVNGGGTHGIDVETATGEIRLLQLHPQP